MGTGLEYYTDSLRTSMHLLPSLRRAGVILVALLASSAWTSCTQHTMTVAEVERTMKETIPVGTTRERAIAILDSLEIEHSSYDSEKRTITGIVRNTSSTATTKSSIQVVLSFDAEDRLSAHEIREVFTGP